LPWPCSKGAYNSMDGLGTVSTFRKSLEVLSLVPDEGRPPRKKLCMDPRRSRDHWKGRTVNHSQAAPMARDYY